MARRELGARCERAHKTLATAHLGFLATSAAAVAASEFLSDSAGSKRVDLLTFSLTAKPQFLLKLWLVVNSLHSTPWQTIFEVISQLKYFCSFIFCHVKKPSSICVSGCTCVWEMERFGFNFASGPTRTERTALMWLCQTIWDSPCTKGQNRVWECSVSERAFGLKLPSRVFYRWCNGRNRSKWCGWQKSFQSPDYLSYVDQGMAKLF